MKKCTFLLSILLLSFASMAQVSITVDGSDPDPSAGLEVKFTDKGFLSPRVANVDAVSNPVAGLMVYDQSVNCMRYYDGTAWSECMGKSFYCGLPFTDIRDGKSYYTAQIGTQCWMAENLNVGTMIDNGNAQTDNDTIEKYCYNNSTTNCDTYGGLYKWDEMMQYVTTEGTQGICPVGWHLPSDDEWKILEGTVDSLYPVGDNVWNEQYSMRGFDVGKNLKSAFGWNDDGNGADLYGFGALPGGYWWSTIFEGLGNIGYWWSSSEHSQDTENRAWYRMLRKEDDKSGRYEYHKIEARSVRCLKD